MENILPKVYKNLSSYLMKNRAISKEELMWKIGEELASLTEDETEQLNESLEGEVQEMIFDGITGSVRLSVFSPDMHVQLNYLGEVFYTPPTHKYIPEEMEKAFRRLVHLRFPSISTLVEYATRDIIKRAGYEMSDVEGQIKGVQKGIKAVKGDRELQLLMSPSIILIPEIMKELKEMTTVEHAIVVPPEKSPAPFVNFIRENMDEVRKNPGMMIWVVDPNHKTVNPFMGTPKDKEIWNHFTDPDKSLKATTNWIKGAMRSRVLDEDF